MANQSRASTTLVGIVVLSLILASLTFWRTNMFTAWAGSSYPTLEIDGELFYIVRSGDTLEELAAAFGVSTEELIATNNLESPIVLRIGQRLRIPDGSDIDITSPFAELLPSARAAEAEIETEIQDATRPDAVEEDIYIITRGDTLARISRITGVSQADLRAFNRLKPHDALYRGQRLRLTPDPDAPAMQAAPVASPEPVPREYTIRRGDTLQRIARNFGVSVQAIIEANNLQPLAPLYRGQVLTIPVPDTIAPAPETGEVTEDDTAIEDVAEEPADDAAMDEPTLDEAAEDEPVTDEPAMDEAVEDEPVTDEPADVEMMDEATDETTEPDADTPEVIDPEDDIGIEDEPQMEEPQMEEPEAELPDSDEVTEDATDVADIEDADDEADDDTGTLEESLLDNDLLDEDAVDDDEADKPASPTALDLWQEGDEAIYLFTPEPDMAYHSQLEIIGLSQTFEGNVNIELIGSSGELLAERYATGGSIDGYDFFRTHLRFQIDEPTSATLRVFELSMEDGSVMHEIEIPVTLLPGQRFIDIFQPTEGATLCGTVFVAGYSSTFEANVTLELADRDNQVLDETFTMGGAYGIYREFFQSFDFSDDSPRPLLISAFEVDASGRFDRIDPITVPISYFPSGDPACE